MRRALVTLLLLGSTFTLEIPAPACPDAPASPTTTALTARMPARVAYVSPPNGLCNNPYGGQDVVLEVVVDGATRRLRTGEPCLQTTLRVDDTVIVDATFTAAPTTFRELFAWMARDARAVDGYARVVSETRLSTRQ